MRGQQRSLENKLIHIPQLIYCCTATRTATPTKASKKYNTKRTVKGDFKHNPVRSEHRRTAENKSHHRHYMTCKNASSGSRSHLRHFNLYSNRRLTGTGDLTGGMLLLRFFNPIFAIFTRRTIQLTNCVLLHTRQDM